MLRRIFILLVVLLVLCPCGVMGAGNPGSAGLKAIRLEEGTKLLQVGSKYSFRAIGEYSSGT